MTPNAVDILTDVTAEMLLANARFGPQFEMANGTGGEDRRALSDEVRAICRAAVEDGTVTWRHILAEEVGEAFAESSPEGLRAELVQVAAVALRWVAAIDRLADEPSEAA